MDSQIDFTRFEQNFLVQNYALVLPTHLVTYDISQESDESSAPPPLNGSMSVVSLRPAALDDKHKEAILSVCDQVIRTKYCCQAGCSLRTVLQEAVSRAGSNLSFAVDQSYQALWSEVQCGVWCADWCNVVCWVQHGVLSAVWVWVMQRAVLSGALC